jgi:hypothetical protein
LIIPLIIFKFYNYKILVYYKNKDGLTIENHAKKRSSI